jgi:hypothetical protein
MEARRSAESEDAFDFGVDRDVGGKEAVDGEFAAGGFREMEEAADVVVLVITGEQAFGFLGGEAKDGQSNWLAEIPGVGAVQPDEFAQGHEGSAARGFGAHAGLLGKVYRSEKKKERI